MDTILTKTNALVSAPPARQELIVSKAISCAYRVNQERSLRTRVWGRVNLVRRVHSMIGTDIPIVMSVPLAILPTKSREQPKRTLNSDDFTIASTNTNSRRQLKKKEKKGSDDETEQAGKSGKGAMAAGLKESLQTHLGHCGGNTTDTTTDTDGVELGTARDALVQIGKCALGKRKNVACDFHLSIPFNGNETESAADKKEQANSCIIAAFQGSDEIKEALKDFFNSCDVTIKKEITKWDSCGPFD